MIVDSDCEMQYLLVSDSGINCTLHPLYSLIFCYIRLPWPWWFESLFCSLTNKLTNSSHCQAASHNRAQPRRGTKKLFVNDTHIWCTWLGVPLPFVMSVEKDVSTLYLPDRGTAPGMFALSPQASCFGRCRRISCERKSSVNVTQFE